MKIHGTDSTHQLDICIDRDGRLSHTGQDTLPVPELVQELHGRSKCPRGTSRMPNRSTLVNEIEVLDILFIDEHLLTGDLEEDISILSIVA